jgi:hypothetical protein
MLVRSDGRAARLQAAHQHGHRQQRNFQGLTHGLDNLDFRLVQMPLRAQLIV